MIAKKVEIISSLEQELDGVKTKLWESNSRNQQLEDGLKNKDAEIKGLRQQKTAIAWKKFNSKKKVL